MKERPILFSDEMVRAILEGRKTQTRRIVSLLPHWKAQGLTHADLEDSGFWNASGDQWQYGDECLRQNYQVGDRLWVRETWRAVERESDLRDGILYIADGQFREIENSKEAAEKWMEAYANGKWSNTWRPSIFMPRWASRITLEITGVKIERLQGISEEDARAEGIQGRIEQTGQGEKFLYFGHPCIGAETPREAFITAWDQMHNPRGLCAEDEPKGWDADPWVFVIKFKREVSR